MTPRERVIEAIEHRATATVPYNLDIDLPVAEALTEHYGSEDWQDRIKTHIVRFNPFDPIGEQRIDEVRMRDMFGSVWRTEMSRGGGYVLGPAKALQPGTPIENAVACLEAFTEA